MHKMNGMMKSLSLYLFPYGFLGSLALNVLARFLTCCHTWGLQKIQELALVVVPQVKRKGVNIIDSPN